MHPCSASFIPRSVGPLTRCDTLIKSSRDAGQSKQVWQSLLQTIVRPKPQIGPIRQTQLATNSRGTQTRKAPMSSPLRLSLAALLAVSCLFASLPASAQNSDAKPSDKPAQSQPDADAQRRADEFAEAARQ